MMKWYDIFSNFYDTSLEKLYFGSRERAIDLLELEEGLSVIDIACGTGANFKHIKSRKHNITLFGTDHSAGMLNKAQKLIENNNWNNTFLFQADARLLTLPYIENHTGHKGGFDRVICFLGLSVIPEWEKVMRNLVGLLNDNGKIVIADVFAEKRTFNTWFVEKIAKADLDRKIWQTLETLTDRFYLEYMPLKESKVGGKLFVATGRKHKS